MARIVQFEGRQIQVPDDATDDEVSGILSAQPAPATPAAAPSIAGDMAKSVPSGLVRGAVETGMLPVTIERLGSAGMNLLAGSGEERQARDQAMGDAGTDFARWLFGAPALTDEERAQRRGVIGSMKAGGGDVGYGAQDAVRGAMDDTLYAPKTLPGKFAETAAEFAIPGGLPSKSVRAAPTLARKAGEYAADLTRHAVLPGVASEAAGQATEGTAAEPYARVIAAILGNVGGAVMKSSAAPEAVLRRAVGPADAVDWEKAIGLQNNSTGVRLTGPEAITQAQGGETALPQLQRVIEGSAEGRVATAPFFSARPAQVDTAVGNVLDKIAPQSPNPSALGPRLAQAAEGAIAASPEGQALSSAVVGAGPRTTALQAGEVIQPDLRNTFDRREGMRNALGDQDYQAARAAEPTIPVDNIQPRNTVREPGYTRLDPAEDIHGQRTMEPTAVPPVVETPSLTSNTGPDRIQVDARPALQTIDRLRAGERGAAAEELGKARGMLFHNGGVDTSVVGLENARDSINGMITAAQQAGDRHVVERLTRAREALDSSLSTSPEFAQANRNFAAASEPLQPFQSPGMAKTISRDEFNARFGTPAEQVPDALTAPSEARNFNTVASPEARTAMENRVATMVMDQATDGAGNISPERLSLALRNNEDTLSQFPAVAERLRAVADASGNMANARTGPIGAVAAAGDTSAAGNAILPQNPLVGSHGETADAVQRLAAQDNDATAAVLRQILGDRYSKAATETQEGSREFAGAKFNKDVAGNTQRRQTLDAALGALPNNAAAQATPELLDVLQATGRRKAIGSATEFNRSLNADLGSQSPLARLFTVARTVGASFLTNAGDTVKRTALRHSIGSLADMFTDPRSVELIQEAIARGAPNTLPEAAVRSALQGSIAGSGGSGQR